MTRIPATCAACAAVLLLMGCSQTTARRGATPPILAEAARGDTWSPPPPARESLDVRASLPPDTAIPVRKITTTPGTATPPVPRAETASQTMVSLDMPRDTVADLALPVRKER